jgi:hypothetical protein
MHLQDTNRLPKGAIAVLSVTPLQEGMITEVIASGCTRYSNHEVFRIKHGIDMKKFMGLGIQLSRTTTFFGRVSLRPKTLIYH